MREVPRPRSRARSSTKPEQGKWRHSGRCPSGDITEAWRSLRCLSFSLETGLLHQGWKDGDDAIFYADGSIWLTLWATMTKSRTAAKRPSDFKRSASSVFLLIQASLGMTIDGVRGRLSFVRSASQSNSSYELAGGGLGGGSGICPSSSGSQRECRAPPEVIVVK